MRTRTTWSAAVATALLTGAIAVPASAGVPNDPGFPGQWALHNTGQAIDGVPGTPDADIDAPEAWDLTTGGAGVTVAIVDGGVDPLQEDIGPNLDMASGYDFGMNDPDATEEYGSIHGTQVATVIAARGNNGLGMAGVAWLARIMPLKIRYAPNGASSSAGEAAAFRYAGSHGARVANASFNLAPSRYSQAVIDAIKASPNTLFVSPSGGGTNGVMSDNDASPRYPCNYDLPNHICVGGSDEHDRLWSNYGAKSVDLVAPARRIEVAQGRTTYGPRDGTSFSTAMVSGVAALYFARYPWATVADVRRAILQGVDVIPSMIGKTVTGGRLNAARTLEIPPAGWTPPAPPAPPPPPPPPAQSPAPARCPCARPDGSTVATGTAADTAAAPGAADVLQPPATGERSVAIASKCRVKRDRIAIRRHESLRTVLRRGLRVTVTGPRRRRVTVRVRLTLPTALARRLGVRPTAGRVTARRVRGRRPLRVPVRRSVARRLRALDTVELCVSATGARGAVVGRDHVVLRR
jgi:Subtilase family